MRTTKNQNFISVDEKTVINSYGESFTIGEEVNHQDTEVGTAIIESFKVDKSKNEIRVDTNKGHAHIDFLIKLNNNN